MAITERTYEALISEYKGNDIMAEFPAKLIPMWCDDYCQKVPSAEIVEVELGGFHYLFDLCVERPVVAFGEPIFTTTKRDTARMAGHPLSDGSKYHRGHLIGHSIGGGTDINLVSQLGSVNIGSFRVLERYVRDLAQQNTSCFYFVRAIYSGPSQKPHQIEQCVISLPRSMKYALHPNC